MKALSLTQPWATLVALGAKRIETRSWSTNYRGLLAIQAAKGFPKEARENCTLSPFVRGLGGAQASALPVGQIIATVRLVDVRPSMFYDCDDDFRATDECAFGDYTPGRFAWLLDDVQALPVPIPCKGSLGLWEVPAQIYEAVALQLLTVNR